MNRAQGDKISGKIGKVSKIEISQGAANFQKSIYSFRVQFSRKLVDKIFGFFCRLQTRSKLLRKNMFGKKNEQILTYLQKCKKRSKNRDFLLFSIFRTNRSLFLLKNCFVSSLCRFLIGD